MEMGEGERERGHPQAILDHLGYKKCVVTITGLAVR